MHVINELYHEIFGQKKKERKEYKNVNSIGSFFIRLLYE